MGLSTCFYSLSASTSESGFVSGNLSRMIFVELGVGGFYYWRPGGTKDRLTFTTFTCHLVIVFRDENVCVS